MLKIKLTRLGKKNQPLYRVSVAEGKSKVSGRVTEHIGIYQPQQNPPLFKIDLTKYQSWLSKGAQPTDTLRKLVSKYTK